MPDENPHPIVYRRETLYQEVWAEPVKIVAQRYGVSDVALGKTCRKMTIPLPGRGYWAKKKAGNASPQPPLPAGASGVPEELEVQGGYPPRTPRKVSPETEARMVCEGSETAAIVVDDVLLRPHPLVKEAKMILSGRRRASGLVSCTSVRCLDICVTQTALDRALRIMDALLKALVKRGMRVEVTEVQADANPYHYYRRDPDANVTHYRRDPDANVTRVMVDEEWMVFGLKERLRMVPSVALEPPKGLRGEERVQWIQSHRPTRTFEPSGLLALTIKNAGSLDVRTEWKDGTRMRLEDCLNDIVAHFYLVAEVLREKRLERARWEKEWAVERVEREKERQRQVEDQRRAEELKRQVERWQWAQEIRAYVQALKQATDVPGRAEGSGAVDEWVAWAINYADRVDPLTSLEREAQRGLGENGGR